MIFHERIESSIKFIEDNLDKKFNLKDVAKASGFSLSHFYKIFLSVTGFTVKEYIRNRRLSKAADKLVNTQESIIDIALEAGFNSHEVFTRAFNQLYGISPSKYRSERKEMLTFKKFELFGKEIEDEYMHMRDSINVSVKTLTSDQVILVGMDLHTSVHDAIEKNSIDQFCDNIFMPRLKEIRNIKEPYSLISYEVHNPETDELYDMICVEVLAQNVPKNMNYIIIPPTYYAVFSTNRVLNPIEYGTLTQYIYGEWLPMSGYNLSSDFTLVKIYSNTYYARKSHDTSRLEVYVPIAALN